MIVFQNTKKPGPVKLFSCSINIERLERKRSKCFLTYIHFFLDLFRSHPSMCRQWYVDLAVITVPIVIMWGFMHLSGYYSGISLINLAWLVWPILQTVKILMIVWRRMTSPSQKISWYHFDKTNLIGLLRYLPKRYDQKRCWNWRKT